MEVLQFPQDEESCGGFRARLKFKRWHQSGETEDYREDILQDLAYTLWLPYPAQINTGYAQGFEESDNFHQTSRSSIGQGMSTDRFAGSAKGIIKELLRLGDSMTAVNNSAKMAQGAILNTNMGVTYTGPQLRTHTFSWKLTPKSIEEQDEINKIIKLIKMAATPYSSKLLSSNDSIDTLKAAVVSAERALKSQKEDPGIFWAIKEDVLESKIRIKKKALKAALADKNKLKIKGDVFEGEWVDAITTLSIPYTVEVEFWKDWEENLNLFKVSDSFITQFDVNYTSAGPWAAHEDGSAVETMITMSLKEITNIHQERLVDGNL